MTSNKKARLAIFASGGGSNAEKIIQHFSTHDEIEVGLIYSNRKGAYVIERAINHDIAFEVKSNSALLEQATILDLLSLHKIDYIILAGFLQLIPAYLIKAFQNRIINIHPSLLPNYGGKGMYGKHVHAAVKAANESKSGITIHLVNEKYDEGAIIAQYRREILPSDTSEDIGKKVLFLEHQYYPKVIEDYILNKN